MTTEHNDFQTYLLRKVAESADDYRASCRSIAADLVDSIVAGFASGMSRDEIVDELAAGLVNGKARP